MEEFLLEPVELTDTEIDAVAGGNSAAAAAAGDTVAAALAASTGLGFTIGGATVIATGHSAVGFAD